ncbi:MAG: PA14 domain-containing protein [Planctomycetota bacterium]
MDLSLKLVLSLCLIFCAGALVDPAMARERIDLSGPGWELWLDKEASYRNDALYLPPVDLNKLPVHAPTCGWEKIPDNERFPVSVPGTVEEYLFGELNDYQGVSWWMRDISFPLQTRVQRVKLCFEAVRLRCEIYLDRKLVGYDLIGNTPFEVDITDHVVPGRTHHLALRITDPGGNFDWIDYTPQPWGKYMVPASHGFGGVTGRVSLLLHDEVYIKDIFIKNKPSITEADALLTLVNEGSSECTGEILLRVEEATCASGAGKKTTPSWNGPLEIRLEAIRFPPGEQATQVTLTAPGARIWDLDDPALYQLSADLRCAEQGFEDCTTQRFGFRWFEVEGHGEKAVFRLNHRRIVLRSAISWGFWPVNGIYPTPDLAKKHVAVAKELGLNMLHFHRCIGWPMVLDQADEQGLLYYEEPGGYTVQGGTWFAWGWAREKLLRMVRRDRNHPSLVIYNMINEQAVEPMDHHLRDMRDAHDLDPTRIITFVSGWAEEGEDPFKLHMLPYDPEPYRFGWYDCHHAPGPGCYLNTHYNNPKDYNLYTENSREIDFYGEEGAIAAPPRLPAMQEFYERLGKDGWDGGDYRAWHEAYKTYFREKGLEGCFPSIDALIEEIGTVALDYHGRMIENIRINDNADGYVINGYEGEKLENHSGIVDCLRQVKGDKEVLIHYNQPLYVAIKVNDLVAAEGGDTMVDLFIINEKNLQGPHMLQLSCTPPDGKEAISVFEGQVRIEGGDLFGQRLAEGLPLSLNAGPGHYTLTARLIDEDGTTRAMGRERVFAVPGWREIPISRKGALMEWDGEIADFLKTKKGLTLPAYRSNMGKLDYVVTNREYRPRAELISKPHLRTPEGHEGVRLEYFEGMNFETLKGSSDVEYIYYISRTDPLSDQIGTRNFSLRWTGCLIPSVTGNYLIVTRSDDGVRLWLDGKLEIDNWTHHFYEANWAGVDLEAGREYEIKLEYFQAGGAAGVSLEWVRPDADWVNLAELLMRVKNDGTTLFIFEDAPGWAKKISLFHAFTYHGEMKHKRAWLGGSYFVREHPFFAGLPVNCAMNWEYQALVRYDNRTHTGLIMDGEEAVVGSVTGHEHQVATSLGVVPVGKGKIVLSTLSIVPHLSSDDSAAEIVKRIFCNFLAEASPGEKESLPR